MIFFFNSLLLGVATAPPTLDGWAHINEPHEYIPTHSQRLQRHLLQRRGPDIVKPKMNISQPVDVKFKMELYQIIELNERQQYVTVSVWVIERWFDEFLYWDPEEFGNITETKLHHSSLWVPDTTLYNTLVMKDDDQRRPQHVKLTTDFKNKRALVEFLYPAIYKFYCRLYLQFFPFDSQTCKMIFGSWTSDVRDIDYFSLKSEIGTSNFMQNEGWYLQATEGESTRSTEARGGANILTEAIGTSSYVPNDEWNLLGIIAQRNVVKYVCCAYNYTLLDFTLYLRRRPLFYLVNLIVPTFIITLIAITGFFTTSSTTGVREEKISLCITTLLSMSILMLMISDQMPSTSTFIPLISVFYMAAILIISVGALAASFIISVQKFGHLGQRLPPRAVAIAKIFSYLSLVRIPEHLLPNKKLIENLKPGESMDMASRKSTITQFAKFVFTAGTEEVTESLEMFLSRCSCPGESVSCRFQGYPGYPSTNCCSPSDSFSRRKDARQPHLVDHPPMKKQNSDDYEFRPRIMSTNSENTETDKICNTNKRLAKIEYDWLATVIERCTFLVFLFVFLLVSLGINFVGLIHWLNSAPPPEAISVNAVQ